MEKLQRNDDFASERDNDDASILTWAWVTLRSNTSIKVGCKFGSGMELS